MGSSFFLILLVALGLFDYFTGGQFCAPLYVVLSYALVRHRMRSQTATPAQSIPAQSIPAQSTSLSIAPPVAIVAGVFLLCQLPLATFSSTEWMVSRFITLLSIFIAGWFGRHSEQRELSDQPTDQSTVYERTVYDRTVGDEVGNADSDINPNDETAYLSNSTQHAGVFVTAHRPTDYRAEVISKDRLLDDLRSTPIVSRRFIERALNRDGNLNSTRAITTYLRRSGLLTEYQSQLFQTGQGRHLSLGDYWILSFIAAGGAGVVLRARHKQFGLDHALKILQLDESRANQVKLEMEAATELVHQNICVVRETGEIGDLQFIAMEWINGASLHSMLQRDGALSVGESLQFALQAARGLAFAHDRGMVHRDVKPGNLMLDSTGNIKVVDFGLVGTSSEPSVETDERVRSATGTLEYIAPEQAAQFSSADHRSDIFGLGATLFSLLTGKTLRGGANPVDKYINAIEGKRRSLRGLLPHIPVQLHDVVKLMTERRPEKRLQSMHEVIESLEQVADALNLDCAGLEKLRILLVEDVASDRDYVNALLGQATMPVEVVFAETIQDAIELLQGRRFDVAIVDLSLPDSDGLSSVVDVRSVAPWTPIVVITGTENIEVGIECIRAGADDYIPKDQLSSVELERRLLLALSRQRNHAR